MSIPAMECRSLFTVFDPLASTMRPNIGRAAAKRFIPKPDVRSRSDNQHHRVRKRLSAFERHNVKSGLGP